MFVTNWALINHPFAGDVVFMPHHIIWAFFHIGPVHRAVVISRSSSFRVHSRSVLGFDLAAHEGGDSVHLVLEDLEPVVGIHADRRVGILGRTLVVAVGAVVEVYGPRAWLTTREVELNDLGDALRLLRLEGAIEGLERTGDAVHIGGCHSALLPSRSGTGVTSLCKLA